MSILALMEGSGFREAGVSGCALDSKAREARLAAGRRSIVLPLKDRCMAASPNALFWNTEER